MISEAKEISEKTLWSKHYAQNGVPYYYNVQTGASQWDKPECLQDEESEVAPEWQQYITEEGKEYWYNATTRERRWQNPEQEVDSSDQEENPPDPFLQFNQLLRENKVSSSMKWDQVVKQLSNDSRWKCIGSISEKKKIFNKYLQDLKQNEKEENKSKLSYAKEDFLKMLEEHKITTSDIRLYKVQSYLINDPRWKAIPEDKERETLFQDYLDRLYESEREQMRITRRTSTEEFRKKLERFIELEVLNHASTWDQCLNLFSQDRLIQIMVPYDALGVFEEVINPLYEQWKSSIISRELLQEQLSEGLLTHKSKWQQFAQTILNDERFENMLGQPGSAPHELFQDFVAHLKQNHQIYKSELKLYLQSKGVKSLLNATFEEVDGMFGNNQTWSKMPIHEKKYYYRYFQENLKQTSNSQTRRFKKLRKRFFKVLKSIDSKSYEECLPIINQKIAENAKLQGLTEEQKKMLFEEFNIEDDSDKKKKKKKKDKDREKENKKKYEDEPDKVKQTKIEQEYEPGEYIPIDQEQVEPEREREKPKKSSSHIKTSKKHHK